MQNDFEYKTDTLENLLLLVRETNWNIEELVKDRRIKLSQREKDFIWNMQNDYNTYEIKLKSIVNRNNIKAGRKRLTKQY